MANSVSVNHGISRYSRVEQVETVALAASLVGLLVTAVTVFILGILYLRQVISSPHHFGRAVCALGAPAFLLGAFALNGIHRSTQDTGELAEDLKWGQCLAMAVTIAALACIAIGLLQLYGILNPVIVAKTFVLSILFIGLSSGGLCGCVRR